MRDYAAIPLDIFSRPNWRLVRGDCEAMAVGLYLWSCGHSNMLGAYRLPPTYVAEDLGLDLEVTRRALLRLAQVGVCVYDEAESFIFVPDMGEWQCQGVIKAADNRTKALKKLWDRVPPGPVRDAVLARYGEAFHLSSEKGGEGVAKALESSFEGASEVLRSQEQETEQKSESPARAPEASPEAKSLADALTKAGCPDASPFDPVLQAVFVEIPAPALIELANRHQGKGLKYLVNTYRGRQTDMASQAHGVRSSGASVGPAPRPALGPPRELEDAETAAREARRYWQELGADVDSETTNYSIRP